MTIWSELTSRDKPEGLPEAIHRQISPDMARYVFIHDDLEVDDPAVDSTGRFFVSPREYGFTIRGYKDILQEIAKEISNVVRTNNSFHPRISEIRTSGYTFDRELPYPGLT